MIKLIISDIGGVLIKTDEAIIFSIEKVFNKLNIPKGNKEDILKVFGVSIYDYILAYLPNEHKSKVDICYKEFKLIYPDKAVKSMKVFEKINETLDYIKNKGIKIAILSCMIKKEVEVNLSLLKFKEFNLIFSLDDYKFKRPEPIGLQMIMEELNVGPQETIYIGDTLNDVLMAKNAGCISVAVKTGMQNNSELKNADYLIDSFKDIIKFT